MKYTKLIASIFVLAILLVVVSNYSPTQAPQEDSTGETKSSETQQYKNITAEEFDFRLASADVFVIATHIPEQEHIMGTDIFIPFSEIEANLSNLPANKDAEILVYCRSGNMSQTASQTLVDLGYTNVNNLLGGKKAYDQFMTKNQTVSIMPDTQDLGTVIFGDVPETTFTISNTTDQEIALTRVSTSCGCTKAFPEKDTVAAGESIEMRVTFDPAVHGDDTDLGEVTRTIYVQTDHPDFTQLENTITANVIKP